MIKLKIRISRNCQLNKHILSKFIFNQVPSNIHMNLKNKKKLLQTPCIFPLNLLPDVLIEGCTLHFYHIDNKPIRFLDAVYLSFSFLGIYQIDKRLLIYHFMAMALNLIHRLFQSSLFYMLNIREIYLRYITKTTK